MANTPNAASLRRAEALEAVHRAKALLVEHWGDIEINVRNFEPITGKLEYYSVEQGWTAPDDD